jgi:hypothetical protein
MDEEKRFLKEWITHFLNSRNAVFRTIESINPHDKYDLHVKHKTKDQYVVALPEFTPGVLDSLSQENHILLVGFNTQANFQFLLDNWKQLASFPNLTVYFINPASDPDTRWVISPYVHSRGDQASGEECKTGNVKGGQLHSTDYVQIECDLPGCLCTNSAQEILV